MTFEVIVVNISQIRGIWETRVKKYRERCKKEKERLETSALQKIKQEWSFMLECRNKGIPQSEYLKNGFVDTTLEILDTHLRNSSISKWSASKEEEPETSKFIFSLWCLRNLRELNLSFNNLKNIPPELGDCENLLKLDLSGNLELSELPFELSNLKKVTFVDLSANKFSSVPICVLRMSNLQWLDISSNNLKDLPQDIDRLEGLETLLMQKNAMTYLPIELANLSNLKLLVVSGDNLVEIPSALVENPSLKYVKLLDNPIEGNERIDIEPEEESNHQDREQFEKEFMKSYIKDLVERDSAPCYTTKVMLNLQI
ncbi:hypothetical protein GDO81_001702 [Engystomops pustulosus]|uniref:Leucine-rich repeat-containing protein 2 n=1 Tax=Engystomops pustulosus TaxID=76066 RepID=A0AAV7DIK8_ENGPU|nr:hypothetical protein GDO81_001702 [Engystomops pustulosus]